MIFLDLGIDSPCSKNGNFTDEKSLEELDGCAYPTKCTCHIANVGMALAVTSAVSEHDYGSFGRLSTEFRVSVIYSGHIKEQDGPID